MIRLLIMIKPLLNKILFVIFFILSSLVFGEEGWQIKNKKGETFTLTLNKVDGVFYVPMKDFLGALHKTDKNFQVVWDDQFGILRVNFKNKIYSFFKDKSQLLVEQRIVQTDHPLRIFQGEVLIPESSISLLNQFLEIFELGTLPLSNSSSEKESQNKSQISKPPVSSEYYVKSDKGLDSEFGKITSQQPDSFSIFFDSPDDSNIISSQEILKNAIKEKPAIPKKIFIDPDPVNSSSEKGEIGEFSPNKITTAIANRVREILSRNQELTVEIPKAGGREDTIEEKINQLNISGADLLLLLRCDNSQFESNSGIQIYCMHSAIDKEGTQIDLSSRSRFNLPYNLNYLPYQNLNLIFGAKLFEEIKSNVPVEVRGLRLAPIVVLKRSTMPSALLIIGFYTNPKDARLLASVGFQEILARSIAGAILNYSNFIRALNTSEK